MFFEYCFTEKPIINFEVWFIAFVVGLMGWDF